MSSTLSQSPTRPWSRPIKALVRRGYHSDNPLPIALGYLALLTLAEVLTVLVVVQLGLLLHLSILFLLLLHAAAIWERPLHRLLMALAFVPLIRVISMSLPLAGFPLVYWYLITSVPLFVAAVVVMRLLGFSWRDVGLDFGGPLGAPVQLLIGASGLALGYAEYLILRPEPLADEFTLAQIWLPALVLLISTGFLEELIFRGILQRTAVDHLGRWRGILYVAVFFAVLHIGYQSLADVLFVLAVGLAFGLIVQFTGSLLGVTLAHGLTNISLFLIVPLFIGATEPPRPSLSQAITPAAGISQVIAASTIVPPATPAPTASATADSVIAPAAAFLAATPRPTATAVLSVTASPAPTQTTPPSPAVTETAATVPAGVYLARHVVQPGQPLSVLARYYQTTEEAIRSQNNLSAGALLEIGQLLWIPVERALPVVPTGRSHVIQSGETLSRIARQYGTTTQALVGLNWLPTPNLIIPGQVLWLPPVPALPRTDDLPAE